MPGIIGSTGWDRSSAWIWLFVRHEEIFNLGVAYADLWVPWYSGAVHTTVWFRSGVSDGLWCAARRCCFRTGVRDLRRLAVVAVG